MLMTKVDTPEYFGEICPISVVVEIPEQLHDSVVQFTESSDWNYNDVVQEALNLFLLAQKKGDRIETIVCPECGEGCEGGSVRSGAACSCSQSLKRRE